MLRHPSPVLPQAVLYRLLPTVIIPFRSRLPVVRRRPLLRLCLRSLRGSPFPLQRPIQASNKVGWGGMTQKQEEMTAS